MKALSLESFDAPAKTETSDDAIYQAGFLAGIAEAERRAEGDQTTLRAGLVQAVSDLQFTYVEAQTDFLASLRPLMAAIPKSVLPACVEAAFCAQITDLLSEAANGLAGHRMAITVHPSAFQSVQAALAENAAPVALDQDPTLSPNAIWVGRSDSESMIDLDALSHSIQDVLSAITVIDAKRERNG